MGNQGTRCEEEQIIYSLLTVEFDTMVVEECRSPNVFAACFARGGRMSLQHIAGGQREINHTNGGIRDFNAPVMTRLSWAR